MYCTIFFTIFKTTWSYILYVFPPCLTLVFYSSPLHFHFYCWSIAFPFQFLLKYYYFVYFLPSYSFSPQLVFSAHQLSVWSFIFLCPSYPSSISCASHSLPVSPSYLQASEDPGPPPPPPCSIVPSLNSLSLPFLLFLFFHSMLTGCLLAESPQILFSLLINFWIIFMSFTPCNIFCLCFSVSLYRFPLLCVIFLPHLFVHIHFILQ